MFPWDKVKLPSGLVPFLDCREQCISLSFLALKNHLHFLAADLFLESLFLLWLLHLLFLLASFIKTSIVKFKALRIYLVHYILNHTYKAHLAIVTFPSYIGQDTDSTGSPLLSLPHHHKMKSLDKGLRNHLLFTLKWIKGGAAI